MIAETTDLPTKFRKIVVTDDQGRYRPARPAARRITSVWVRGYGLVDSAPVRATPGQQLALTAVQAPNARAAAQYYPANYWYSMINVPPSESNSPAPATRATASRPRCSTRRSSSAASRPTAMSAIRWATKRRARCRVARHVRFEFRRVGPPRAGRPGRRGHEPRGQQSRPQSCVDDVRGLERPHQSGRRAAGAAAAAGYRAQPRA